jgi:hypothetical protein
LAALLLAGEGSPLALRLPFSDGWRDGAQEVQRVVAAVADVVVSQIAIVADCSWIAERFGRSRSVPRARWRKAAPRVVDVTTGMSSDGAGARLTFGAMALVNDTFLQLVGTETHRGLEGRALGGFWTGGRCCGYATVQEENPPDPTHPRKRCVIDPVEAAVVNRVFRL